MQQRKNILNKKSHSLAFGFFLLLLGFYLFSYSYIENKRQEIFDNMNFKLYNQKKPSSETEEIQIPEISSVEQESNTSLESETDVISNFKYAPCPVCGSLGQLALVGLTYAISIITSFH